MDKFIPEKVYYERAALKYGQGVILLEKYRSMNIEAIEIENHNNIPALRKEPDSAFLRLKKYLVIGVRKSLKFVPNEKTSDYLVPYTSSGCPAMCLYCYLVCNYFKCAYLRVFVNREQMMDKIIRTANLKDGGAVFEIGSNSDLVIENTVTGNLEWTIERFKDVKNSLLTLPTKFHIVDSLLTLEHNGRTVIRMSVNPEYIIKHIEIGTSSLDKRLNALIKLHNAGYKTGLLIAPVVLLDGWEKMYEELLFKLAQALPEGLKSGLKIEVILMTYGYAHKSINEAAFKGTIDVFDAEKMRPSGKSKYRYKKDIAAYAKGFLYSLIKKYLGESEIAYIC